MGLIDWVKRLVGIGDGGGVGGSSSFSSAGDNYICASCRTTFQRQHHQCPTCGGPILVPIEEAESDSGPGSPFG